MLVKDRMVSKVVTARPKTSVSDALTLMKERHIRGLPVLHGHRLVGIVTWTDLMRVSPSPTTGLAIWEISQMLMKTTFGSMMTPDPVTLPPSATIEEAAVLMRRYKIGGLPVMENQTLVGIITESDIFDAFITLMGLRRGGARLTIALRGRGDALEEVVRTIRYCGVQIHSLAAYGANGSSQAVIRVDAPYPLHVIQTLSEHGFEVIHLAPLPDATEQE